MKTELKITEDGSHTLYVPEIDETYHSVHGAIQESAHIFIEKAFRQCQKQFITILEVGFGTGLNAFLTAIEATISGQHVRYITIEKYPLPVEKSKHLNYYQCVNTENSQSLFEKIHEAEWEEAVEINPNFTIEKRKCDFTSFWLAATFDLVYFDAFSPEKQPEMWADHQIQKIYEACNEKAILTTYCAKGSVRRALQTVGFAVERISGPPGKREMLRATKNK